MRASVKASLNWSSLIPKSASFIFSRALVSIPVYVKSSLFSLGKANVITAVLGWRRLLHAFFAALVFSLAFSSFLVVFPFLAEGAFLVPVCLRCFRVLGPLSPLLHYFRPRDVLGDGGECFLLILPGVNRVWGHFAVHPQSPWRLVPPWREIVMRRRAFVPFSSLPL